MSTPKKQQIDLFAAAVATKAVKEGGKAAIQEGLDANAAAVAAFERYESARALNPIAAAQFRATHGAQIERGRQLTEVAAAARPEPTVVLTAAAGAQRVADKLVFDRHAELTKTNPFAAAQFRLANSEAIQRGSKVEIPAPEPSPPNPPNPPDDPPPQAA